MTTSKSVEQLYQKKTPLEHILLRPDTYIGSTEITEDTHYLIVNGALKSEKVLYVPGLYKIFDEIIVNAADNKTRDKSMTLLEIQYKVEGKDITISVKNDGKGIPSTIHKTEKVHVPELIFGHLLTSSNYDDSEKKITGGRNGYGAKLCNIFSKSFKIECCHRGRLYKQSFFNSMKVQ